MTRSFQQRHEARMASDPEYAAEYKRLADEAESEAAYWLVRDAAPDLLEALKPFADAASTQTVVDALSFAPHADVDLTITRGFDSFTIPASAFAKARAAIAKAKGEPA